MSKATTAAFRSLRSAMRAQSRFLVGRRIRGLVVVLSQSLGGNTPDHSRRWKRRRAKR